MGDHKRLLCKKGLHPLEEPNLQYNSEGFRCCKRCKYDADNKRKKQQRAKYRSAAAK